MTIGDINVMSILNNNSPQKYNVVVNGSVVLSGVDYSIAANYIADMNKKGLYEDSKIIPILENGMSVLLG